MKSCRILAGILYACGLLSLLLGLEQISRAQTCTMVEHSPATCQSAHSAQPIENDSGDYCGWVGNDCQATDETDCVDRWGLAYSGVCMLEGLGTGDSHICYKDSSLTFVNVTWYTASCKQDGGDCNCIWEASMTSQPAQVCECYDVSNED